MYINSLVNHGDVSFQVMHRNVAAICFGEAHAYPVSSRYMKNFYTINLLQVEWGLG
jgi:hypothetical protein